MKSGDLCSKPGPFPTTYARVVTVGMVGMVGMVGRVQSVALMQRASLASELLHIYIDMYVCNVIKCKCKCKCNVI